MFLQPLDSAYGLAKHRDGRWEWAVAPGISPSPRYQHAAVSLVAFSSISLSNLFLDSCDHFAPGGGEVGNFRHSFLVQKDTSSVWFCRFL